MSHIIVLVVPPHGLQLSKPTKQFPRPSPIPQPSRSPGPSHCSPAQVMAEIIPLLSSIILHHPCQFHPLALQTTPTVPVDQLQLYPNSPLYRSSGPFHSSHYYPNLTVPVSPPFTPVYQLSNAHQLSPITVLGHWSGPDPEEQKGHVVGIVP